MRLEGKTALITGASRNIGRQIALTFAREGADLVLNTRQSRQELEEVAGQCRKLGVNTHLAMGDVSDPETAAAIVEEGISALGKVDISGQQRGHSPPQAHPGNLQRRMAPGHGNQPLPGLLPD